MLNSLKRDYCAAVRGVLSSLGYTDTVNHFATARRGQALENVMVLTKSLLRRFNVLETWFEPIEVRLQFSSLILNPTVVRTNPTVVASALSSSRRTALPRDSRLRST